MTSIPLPRLPWVNIGPALESYKLHRLIYVYDQVCSVYVLTVNFDLHLICVPPPLLINDPDVWIKFILGKNTIDL